MIVSANLERVAKKIYKQVSKFRKKGWFSKDITEFLIKKYADKKMLIEELNELTTERNKTEDKIKAIAREINKRKE